MTIAPPPPKPIIITWPSSFQNHDRAIQILDYEYEARLEACKHNLQGRINWPKGSNPITVESLRFKLSVLWKALGRWGVTLIGKGFYELSFSSIEYTKGSIGDKKKILFAIIASGVGTPICTDNITSKSMLDRSFGHYAKVLIDMNLNETLCYKILIERKGYKNQAQKNAQVYVQKKNKEPEVVILEETTSQGRNQQDVNLEKEINEELAKRREDEGESSKRNVKIENMLPAQTILSKDTDDANPNVDEQGFQIVINKSTKKAKKKASAQKSSKS
ncbi:hypothetical protein MTR_5g047910 [Medicago truncatula]|uniref:DUF4283 domain protein n=1 Tax=Medicago truncatula TaxID=3880 RepID=G7JZ75_MEDTR|nr:hypothetical protein MTR_5g047910 [Medicago truncatula]